MLSIRDLMTTPEMKITIGKVEFPVTEIDTELIQQIDKLQGQEEGSSLTFGYIPIFLEYVSEIIPDLVGIDIFVKERNGKKIYTWKGSLEGLIEMMIELTRLYWLTELGRSRSESLKNTCQKGLHEAVHRLAFLRGDTDIEPGEQTVFDPAPEADPNYVKLEEIEPPLKEANEPVPMEPPGDRIKALEAELAGLKANQKLGFQKAS